jgi:hypothetical protein
MVILLGTLKKKPLEDAVIPANTGIQGLNKHRPILTRMVLNLKIPSDHTVIPAKAGIQGSR